MAIYLDFVHKTEKYSAEKVEAKREIDKYMEMMKMCLRLDRFTRNRKNTFVLAALV
jgi:hypothetical protein